MSSKPSIISADDQRLSSYILAAKTRVVFVAPGLSEMVANALVEKWEELGQQSVQIILDVDPEVSRIGFGTLEGFKLVNECAQRLNSVVHYHIGLRIGLLITDDMTLVYSPTPLLVESDASGQDRTNAIQLNTSPPEILRDVGIGNNEKQPAIGSDVVDPATIKRMEDDLKSNPPVKFDLARKVRVFTSKFQFVEFEMTGIYISRKRVPIPSSLIGLNRNRAVQSQFHAHFNLVNQERLEVKANNGRTLTEKSLHTARQDIVRRFLIPLKGYGMVVLRTNKDDLINAVEKLRTDVLVFQNGVKDALQESMNANITALIDGLFPAVKQNPPDQYIKFHGRGISDEDLLAMLDSDINRAFGKAESLVKEMRVSLVFKNMTYESLKDESFIDLVQKAVPGIHNLCDEFDAVKAIQEELPL